MASSMNIVKVGRIPGKISEICVNGGTTIDEALEICDYDSEGYDIRLNGDDAEGDDILSNGDEVVLVKSVKGNL